MLLPEWRRRHAQRDRAHPPATGSRIAFILFQVAIACCLLFGACAQQRLTGGTIVARRLQRLARALLYHIECLVVLVAKCYCCRLLLMVELVLLNRFWLLQLLQRKLVALKMLLLAAWWRTNYLIMIEGLLLLLLLLEAVELCRRWKTLLLVAGRRLAIRIVRRRMVGA